MRGVERRWTEDRMSYGVDETIVIQGAASEPPSNQSDVRESTSPIPRSATYTDLPTEANNQNFPIRTDSIRRSFSETGFPFTHVEVKPESTSKTSAAEDKLQSQHGESERSSFTEARFTGRSVTPQFSVGVEQNGEESADESTQKEHLEKRPERITAKRSVSDSITKLARRSWIAASRSPSPAPNRRRSRIEPQKPKEQTENNSPANIKEQRDNTGVEGSSKSTNEGLTRRSSFLGRAPSRQLGSFKRKKSTPETPSVPPLPKSFSTDKLPSLKHRTSNLSDAPAVPSSASYERLRNLKAEIPRRRDELWSVFRSLDGDFSKFQSRPSITKTAIIRSALLPFLKNYAEHPSNKNLRPEDIDRRTVILNKWWTGLLEMLNGRHGESVSGNDRPAVLEAASAIMVRPEWTLMSTTTPPRTAKGPKASLISRSTTSLGSTTSDFLVESVFHNVKNTYTQNLIAQMAYVVQKMSNRNIPASVVAFCGKATAYAFFYCEGVASTLVRLWGLSAETLRRITAEYGLSRNANLGTAPDRLSSSFPPCLTPLALKSIPSMIRHLRSEPHLPIAVASIPWRGPWVTRWAGRDTDLLFIFTKHFSELICRYLPDDLPPEEQIAAPAWALVQAQLLKMIHLTIQRSRNPHMMTASSPSPSSSFDEALGEADAAATILPFAANGAVRSMAENRVIMLLRDCLANTDVMSTKAQKTFAVVFDRLLKAAAHGTSVFDHNACFTLCDFLEEAIAILVRYSRAMGGIHPEFDWDFWFDVCKRMLQSQNTMTQIRIYAFLYSMWGIIIESNERKHDVCETWLLSTEMFRTQFCHWCPMVRAHYMRFLIWKLARPSQVSSSTDQLIHEMLSNRLEEAWAMFLHLQEIADHRGSQKLSTTPCSPAPGRQLLILRDDIQSAPSGMFLSFDGILSSSNLLNPNPYEKHSSQSHTNGLLSPPIHENEGTGSPSGKQKKKWDLLKNIMPFTSHFGERSSGPSLQSTTPKSNGAPRTSSTTSPGPHIRPGGSSDAPKTQRDVHPRANHLTTYRSLSFRFSLEWTQQNGQSLQSDPPVSHPNLPPLAAAAFKPQNQSQETSPNATAPTQAKPHESDKYVGRALAEWNLLIAECENFFERRRAEGVPSYHLVETPTLSVDSFRRV